MRRTAAILTLVAVVSLLGTSDVRGGAALVSPGKTTGSTLTATIVTDVTQGGLTKGQTTIRVQKASTSTAAMFNSTGYVANIRFSAACINEDIDGVANFPDLDSSTAFWFTGLIDGLIQNDLVQTPLIQPFGTPGCAAISDQDYVACTLMHDGRILLSFTATIVFKNPNFEPFPGCP